jgi:multidrug efflux pump subunit AcrB
MPFADQINLVIAIATGLSVVVSAIMATMTYAILKANRATVEVKSRSRNSEHGQKWNGCSDGRG